MTISLVPYLVMNGSAEEAAHFYKEALGAEIVMLQKFGDMPANPNFAMPEELKPLVAHAHLKVDEANLYLYDEVSGNPVQQGNHVTICINTKDASQTRKLFEALSQGGTVKHALEETFFSPAFGTVIDKYGVTFTLSTEATQQQ